MTYNDQAITLDLTGDEADAIALVIEGACETWQALLDQYPEDCRPMVHAQQERDWLGSVLVKIQDAFKEGSE